jgi:glycosyltransferase involved in cell wall biosynthesis
MATGNGAYIIHQILGNKIPNYHICGYNPYWTLCPPALPFLCRRQGIPDIIHTTPDYAGFFYRKSIPLVITFHNYVLDRWMRPYSSWLQRIHYTTDLKLFTRLALKKAHTITAVSQFTARLVQQDLKKTFPVRVIYNGVDTNKFTPASTYDSSPKEIRVLFSGNLTRRKGAHWLPLIAKRLKKNVRIYYTQGLRTKKAMPSIAGFESIGAVPFKEMPALYRQMDILLMPSVREGFGLAVAEAMACGLPVVASSCSAIPELINDGKGGFLCHVGDVNAFAEKINFLTDSPQLRHEMGEYNRSKVEKMFTIERMVNEYRELFEEVLS